jgi:hypothetical protein
VTPYVIIAIWLFCAVITVGIAHFRKLSIKSWIVLGVILGPFAVAYALSPDNARSNDWRGRGSGPNPGDGGGRAGCGGGGDGG